MRIAVVVALCALFAALAHAEGKPKVWIASGESGGTYRSIYATQFEKQLRSYDVFHRKTTGSSENLALLASGDADIAFAQADVYAGLLRQDPQRYEDLQILGRLAEECVFIAHRKAGPVKQLRQLAAPVDGRPARIAVGPESGGMSGTWSYMVILEPPLASASADPAGDTLALNQLVVGAYDAVGWVTDPQNLNHKMLRAVRANSELAIMDIADKDLSSQLPDGIPVYVRRKIALEEGWRPDEIETICTSALVFARKDADAKLVSKVADIISLYPAN